MLYEPSEFEKANQIDTFKSFSKELWKTPVSVWTLVARTDVPYMLQTIPHQLRSCNYPFVEKVLAVDTAPLTGDKVSRYNTGSQKDLEVACQRLVEQGVADRIVKIDYEPARVKQIYQKYFGSEQAKQMLSHTHNWKGSTVYASLYCIEESATNYFLHFDADMLLHQAPNFDWISEAINLMKSVGTIAAIRPLCGAPHPEGKLFQPNPYLKDERGFYAHKFFSMRAYLIDRQQFAKLSPIPLMWKFPPLRSRLLPPPLQNLSAKIEGKLRHKKSYPPQGAIESFEPMTSKRLQMTDFVRADLASPQAWTIHPAKHGADFIDALPKLIQLIEQGQYPPEQAGHYDLLLDAWWQLLSRDRSEDNSGILTGAVVR
jgi:hypothetical protein